MKDFFLEVTKIVKVLNLLLLQSYFEILALRFPSEHQAQINLP